MLSSSNMRRIKGRIALTMMLLQLLICILSSHSLSITTFNILAPVHRSMGVDRELLLNGLDPLCPHSPSYYNDDDDVNHRESEREDWWRPRAEGVADYISKKFSSSDVVLLQEWWFDEKFISIFNSKIGDTFEIISERRPAGERGKMRDDGMCCLIRKDGQLELVKSDKVLTGTQRIAQIVQCREKCKDGSRDVFISNSHLSYPGHEDQDINNKRQEKEAGIILDALKRASSEWKSAKSKEESLEIVCGDFNSNSCGLAAKLCETKNFVNCQSAVGEQMLTSIGGQVNVGVTHCDHLGKRVSVDHIFLKLNKKQNTKQRKDNKCAALALGYLDTKGTRIVCVRCDDIELEGSTVLSDHRPVTAKIAWPRTTDQVKEILSSDIYLNVTRPLDPLEPAWGIVDE